MSAVRHRGQAGLQRRVQVRRRSVLREGQREGLNSLRSGSLRCMARAVPGELSPPGARGASGSNPVLRRQESRSSVMGRDAEVRVVPGDQQGRSRRATSVDRPGRRRGRYVRVAAGVAEPGPDEQSAVRSARRSGARRRSVIRRAGPRSRRTPCPTPRARVCSGLAWNPRSFSVDSRCSTAPA